MGKEKKKYKMKNKKLWFLLILIVLLGVVGISYGAYKYIETTTKKDIKNHYNTYVITNKKTSLYNKKEKPVGEISKDFSLELESIKITNTKAKYFKIKDTDYYIYYKDVEKTKKIKKEEVNENYLVFNKNIQTKEKITFYKEDKKVLTLSKGINAPIEYEDKEHYTIYFQNQLLQVKKEDKVEEMDSKNTEEKESDHISVLYYATIKDTCTDYNCIPSKDFKEQIQKLLETGYYTITEEEYENYLDGYIHLKDQALFLTTSASKEETKPLIEELKVHIETVTEDSTLKYTTNNKTTSKETTKDSVNRYQVKSYSTMENILKMASGEEVVEQEPRKVSTSSSNEQGVAVLNYHFFYDEALGGCNEGICLSTKKFREHLQYLKDNNFKVLTMEEFKKWMYGEIEVPKKSVLITIDDGAMGTGKHNGNYLIPLLEEYKMHATLFLISGWWSIENYRSDYLTVQSHTHDMHQYGSCGHGQINCATYEEALQDLRLSLTVVDNDDSFCFPFYYYSDTSIQAVKDAGFKLAFVGGNRKATRSSNKYLVPRYPIHSDITLQNFINIVN